MDGCQRANCTADLCHNGGTCIPFRNGTEDICECAPGFTGSKCQYDINECIADNGGCHHDCVNTIGTFYCRCWSGFELEENGKHCKDIDECAISNGGCSHRCTQTAVLPTTEAVTTYARRSMVVSIDANAKHGYRLGVDKKKCHPIDPCLEKKGGCQHHCVNENGRARCQCFAGFHLGYDRKTC
ncbi:EGF-like domain protein, partial [Ostertagia ostertagi]